MFTHLSERINPFPTQTPESTRHLVRLHRIWCLLFQSVQAEQPTLLKARRDTSVIESCLCSHIQFFHNLANHPFGRLLSEGLLPFSVTFGKRTTPLFLEERNSDCLVLPPAMHPELSKFRISEKKVEKIFSRTIAFSRYPFPSGGYVLEMEETDIFGTSIDNCFLHLIATGKTGILVPSISYASLNLQIPNFREYSR